jgi:hypothetical protein
MSTAGVAPTTEREPELLGQTVVVIGGSAGIGLETARRARAEGADVILTGRNPDRLKTRQPSSARLAPRRSMPAIPLPWRPSSRASRNRSTTSW